MIDISTDAYMARAAICEAAAFISAPHTRMRPRVFPDGNAWCALYGDDLQCGVAGFGKTPAEACADFDKNWSSQRLLADPDVQSSLASDNARLRAELAAANEKAARDVAGWKALYEREKECSNVLDEDNISLRAELAAAQGDENA